MPRYGVNLAFIGSGPNSGDLGWTRRFLTKLTEKGEGALGSMWGWALHHYSWNTSRGATTDWFAGKGDAVAFSNDEWYELLVEADKMDGLISGHWAVMREIDRTHRVKLVVDEWGAWFKQGTEVDPAHLFGQQSTVRDALVSALTLDTFHRHADKVVMANVAQLVNCLQSLFLADEDRFVATPVFHVFEMYGAHVGRPFGSRRVLGASDCLRAREGQRIALGARRIRVREGQDADADRGESARQRGARDRDRDPGGVVVIGEGDDDLGAGHPCA